MESEFSSPEAAQKERTFNIVWAIRVLGVGIIATAIASIFYATSSAGLQSIILKVTLLLLCVCGFIVAMLCIGLHDANKWLKNERDKT
jgi:hypothetical protein